MPDNSELLEKKDIRPSYQRLRVLGFMQQAKGHPTVDEIYKHLSAEIPSLSRTTVYNTLHTLVRAGLVRVLNIDHDETRYEINLHDHGHFRCIKCGSITHFKLYIDLIPTEGLDHYQIQEKNVYYAGLCPECLKRR
jgi:Fe2+ or Zn2+ uptake regulation protein